MSSPIDALRQLKELLDQEERALIAVDLDGVIALLERKTELVTIVEEELSLEGVSLPLDIAELARDVHEMAHKNRFLLRHLRSCLNVVTPIASPQKHATLYGRDGQTTTAGAGSMVRVRL